MLTAIKKVNDYRFKLRINPRAQNGLDVELNPLLNIWGAVSKHP
jgi:hypothetical protein